jgi:hypothetical protein
VSSPSLSLLPKSFLLGYGRVSWIRANNQVAKAQEEDALSDADFESDNEEEEMNQEAQNSGGESEDERDGDGGRPPKKKVRSQ